MKVQVKSLAKKYGNRTVLDSIQFTAFSGECLGVIGPNGSGKSTLLKLLSGIERPDAGQVIVDGLSIDTMNAKQIARKIAVVLQDALPAIDYSVRSIIQMGRYPHQTWLGTDQSDSSFLIQEIAHTLCLEHLLDRSVQTLSGGERQRVAIARAMAQQPKLLLLDEPTTFLDIGYQMQMMDMVQRWQKEQGITVVAVLHDLNIAAQYCDRILVMNHGQQVELGTPNQVINDLLIESVYGTKPIVLQHPMRAIPQILLQPGTMPLQ